MRQPSRRIGENPRSLAKGALGEPGDLLASTEDQRGDDQAEGSDREHDRGEPEAVCRLPFGASRTTHEGKLVPPGAIVKPASRRTTSY
jgi:hypothetical protein